MAERGLLPNLVAVDFYERGDLFAVVDVLNEVGRGRRGRRVAHQISSAGQRRAQS